MTISLGTALGQESATLGAAGTRELMIGASAISIGRYSYGIEDIVVQQFGEGAALQIGAFCSVAPRATIFLGMNHRVDWISTYPFGWVHNEELALEPVPGHPSTNGDVIIGNDVWIARGCTVMSGVTIGDGAVLAANTTVTKNVPAYHIVGGNPGAVIAPRFSEDVIERLLALRWWDLPVSDIRSIYRTLSAAPDAAVLDSLIDRFRSQKRKSGADASANDESWSPPARESPMNRRNGP